MAKKLPKVATQLLPKVPKLGSPPSYKSFFKTVIVAPENRKFIIAKGKAAIDAEWEARLRESPDAMQAKQHLAQATVPEALKLWESYQSRLGFEHKIPNAQADAAVAAAGLRLPQATGSMHRRDNLKVVNTWKHANYADFAKSLERLNSSVTLDKQLTDDAFRASVNALPARLTSTPQDQKEIDRCLGKESTKYWKHRETS